MSHLLGQHELSGQFWQLMNHKTGREKSAEGLVKWCANAEKVAAYKGFVRGLRQDYAAVKQAFVSGWSNG